MPRLDVCIEARYWILERFQLRISQIKVFGCARYSIWAFALDIEPSLAKAKKGPANVQGLASTSWDIRIGATTLYIAHLSDMFGTHSVLIVVHFVNKAFGFPAYVRRCIWYAGTHEPPSGCMQGKPYVLFYHLEMLKILENAEIVLVKLQLIESSYPCSLHKGLIHSIECIT